jgi:hypothetical protein
MKQKIFVMIAFALIMVSMMSLASAEITVRGYNKVATDIPSSLNATRMSVYITIDDTSDTGISKQKDINISVVANHYIAYLPAELNRTLVACSYQGIHTSNTYDADGNLINSTVIIDYQEINVSVSSGTVFYVTLKDRDTYEGNYLCYWSDTMNDELFQIWFNDTTIGGDFRYLTSSLDVGFPSWTCKACARQDYEQIITEYIQAQQTQANYLNPFLFATNLTTMVAQFWLVIYWTVRIFVILILIGIAFAVIIWIYQFVKRMAQQM